MKVELKTNHTGFTYDDRTGIFRGHSNMQELINPESMYPQTLALREQLELARISGMARRIIRLLPSKCWKNNVEVYEDLSSDDTQFEKAYNQLAKQLKVDKYYSKVDILSGEGRFGVLYIGFDDGKEPFEAVERARSVKYLKALSERSVRVDSYDVDPKSPRFGMPVMYSINFQDDGVASIDSGHAGSIRVHHTRLIHVADTEGESEIFGIPRIEPVQWRVIDVERILGGSAAMFWRGGISGISFDLDADADPDEDSVKKLKENVADFMEGLNRYIMTQGVSVNSISGQVTDPNPHFTAQIKYIAATLNVPYRFLIGSEEARLASTQDRQSFFDQVEDRQKNFCTDVIVKPFVERLISLGVLPAPVTEFGVQFTNPDVESKSDQMEYKKKLTEALALYGQTPLRNMMDFGIFLRNVLELSEDVVDALVESYEELNPFDSSNPNDPEEDDDDV